MIHRSRHRLLIYLLLALFCSGTTAETRYTYRLEGYEAQWEVFILERFATVSAQIILDTGSFFAIFDYLVREAVRAIGEVVSPYWDGYFAPIHKVAPAASYHTF